MVGIGNLSYSLNNLSGFPQKFTHWWLDGEFFALLPNEEHEMIVYLASTLLWHPARMFVANSVTYHTQAGWAAVIDAALILVPDILLVILALNSMPEASCCTLLNISFYSKANCEAS